MDTIEYMNKYMDAPDTPEGRQLQENIKALEKAKIILGSWYEQWDARLEKWSYLAGQRGRPDIARIMKLSADLKTSDGQMPYARDHLTGALAYTGDDAYNHAALVKPCTGPCPGTEALAIVDQLLAMDKALLAEYKLQDDYLRKVENDEVPNVWINDGDRESILGSITFDRCYLAQLIARLYGDTRFAEVSHTMQSFLIALSWRTGVLEKTKTEEAAQDLYTRLKRIVHRKYFSGEKGLDVYRAYTKGPSPTNVDVYAYSGPNRITKAVDLAYRALVNYWSSAARVAFGARERAPGSGRPSRPGSATVR
jgi:hypothetical protein